MSEKFFCTAPGLHARICTAPGLHARIGKEVLWGRDEPPGSGPRSDRGRRSTMHHRLPIPIRTRADGNAGRGDWGNLTSGPAGLVTERALTNDVTDYIRFRAVCRAWRQCCADPRAAGHGVLDRRFHPRQWTMVQEKAPRQWTIQMDLPELDGHYVFGPTAEGLLLLVDKRTSVVRLLNPLTRYLAELPPLIPLLSPLHRQWYLDSDGNLRQDSYGDIFTDLGAGHADDTTIALHAFKAKSMLVVTKLGDERWTLLHEGKTFMSTISFGGRFYCATNRAVLVVETGVEEENYGPAPRLVVAAELAFRVTLMRDMLRFSDNGGELMLVHRRLGTRRVLRRPGADGNLNRVVYDMHRVDLDARTTVLLCRCPDTF